MRAATRLEPIDWQAYLEGEERAERKHEYVCGYVYAMADGRRRHHLIASNLLYALGRRLDKSPCQAYGSDMKVRIHSEQGYRFYYPDITVECGPHDPDSVFTDDPVVVVEVLSASTRRIDEGEKREGYLSIPSLAAYVLVDSERLGAAVWRRKGDVFQGEIYAEPTSSIPLPEIDAALPLAELYANVEWPSEPAAEEEM
jgi:Uma2 family endonuclease